MITRAFAERYRDSYTKGMDIDDYVEFFNDCTKAAPDDAALATLTEPERRELAALVISINEEAQS